MSRTRAVVKTMSGTIDTNQFITKQKLGDKLSNLVASKAGGKKIDMYGDLLKLTETATTQPTPKTYDQRITSFKDEDGGVPPITADKPFVGEMHDDGTITPVTNQLTVKPPIVTEGPVAPVISVPSSVINKEHPVTVEDVFDDDTSPKVINPNAESLDLPATPSVTAESNPKPPSIFGDADAADINRDIPIRGDDGELIYMANGRLPAILDKIVKLTLKTFNMKKEVDNWSVRVFPPATKVDNKTSVSMGKANMSVAKRVIAVFGTKEIAEIYAKVQGKEGTGKVLVFPEECFDLQFSVAPHIEVSFNNGKGKMTDAKKGWRQARIDTDPCHRIIVCIDFFVNTQILMDTINREAKDISKGNEETEAALKDMMMQGNPQLTDVQKVMKSAKEVGIRNGNAAALVKAATEAELAKSIPIDTGDAEIPALVDAEIPPIAPLD